MAADRRTNVFFCDLIIDNMIDKVGMKKINWGRQTILYECISGTNYSRCVECWVLDTDGINLVQE